MTACSYAVEQKRKRKRDIKCAVVTLKAVKAMCEGQVQHSNGSVAPWWDLLHDPRGNNCRLSNGLKVHKKTFSLHDKKTYKMQLLSLCFEIHH